MKKLYVLLLALAYLVASTGPVNAEAAFQESKDYEEHLVSIKEQQQAAIHFAKIIHPAKPARAKNFHASRFFLSEPVNQTSHPSSVPIFLLHCNFRR